MFLNKRNFVEVGYDTEEFYAVVFYESSECKICFYGDEKNGDTNCKVAARGAANTANEADGWHYYRALLPTGASVSVPGVPRAPRQILSEIEQDLSRNATLILRELHSNS